MAHGAKNLHRVVPWHIRPRRKEIRNFFWKHVLYLCLPMGNAGCPEQKALGHFPKDAEVSFSYIACKPRFVMM